LLRLSADAGGQITLVAQGDPLVAPQDIKIDRDGNYIVTDIGLVIDPRTGRPDLSRSRNPGKLLRITPDGQVTVSVRMPRARFRAVAPAASGGFLVLDIMGNTLYQWNGGGMLTVIYQSPPLSQPAGVVQIQ
jgi:sugar lactone lactonase YvrE